MRAKLRTILNTYDGDAAALFARMTTQPPPQRKKLIDRLIRDLKAADVWRKLDIFHVMAAHDSQAALLNWKGNASYDLTANSSPTFTADQGYTTNGSSSYLSTTFAPSTGPNFVQDSACFGIWSRTNAQSAVNIAGVSNGNGTTIVPRNTSDILGGRVNQGGSTSYGAITNAIGLSIIDRSGAAATRAFKNGVQSGVDGSSTSASPLSGGLSMGLINTSTFSAAQFAAMLAGGHLADQEHLALYTALNAYMTAVGAA